ncbi:MAG: hypothetical protein IT428_25015 [Planctomycetaceae bacterium]|nr:hypothetical protein [Planctomycetaceae bacterium]
MKTPVARNAECLSSREDPGASVDQVAGFFKAGRHVPRFSFSLPSGVELDRSGWLGDASRRPGAGDDSDGLDDPELDREIRAAQKAHDAHDRQVQRGDVRRLLEGMLEETPGAESMGIDWSVETLESDLRDLATAVRNRSRQDLGGLIDDVLAETASTIGLVVLRGHRVLQRRLALQDRNVKQNPDVWLSDEVRDTLLPSLIEMSLQLAELQRLMATSRRQNALAENRRQMNKTTHTGTQASRSRSGTRKRKTKRRKG